MACHTQAEIDHQVAFIRNMPRFAQLLREQPHYTGRHCPKYIQGIIQRDSTKEVVNRRTSRTQESTHVNLNGVSINGISVESAH